MSQELQVIQDYYDFSVMVLKRIQTFPRNIRHGLGRCLEHRLDTILGLFIRAKYSPRAEKKPLLDAINIELEIVRFELRQATELRAISLHHQHTIISKLAAIGTQVGGWRKSLE